MAHVPTKREIYKNIGISGRSAPALTDEEKLRTLIRDQYDAFDRMFMRAVVDSSNKNAPESLRTLKASNELVWQLCTVIWKFRWVIGRQMFFRVSFGMTGIGGMISALLQLINGYLGFWVSGLVVYRAYKKTFRGMPKLTHREIVILKITIACMEWLRKLYELPITFSGTLWQAVRGHTFTPTEIDTLHAQHLRAIDEQQRRTRDKKLRQSMNSLRN